MNPAKSSSWTRAWRLSMGAVLVAAVATAHAAPPSEESIVDLLVTMKTERTMDAMFASLDEVMKQTMAAAGQEQKLSAQQQRVLDAAMPRIARVIREEMSWPKMRPLYVQIYRESFTQDDVDGLIAFYKSPAGAAYIDKMPLVMQKSMSLMQTQMGPMMKKMQAAIAQAVDEAKTAK